MKEEFGKCGFLSSQDHMQTHQSFPFHGGKSLSLSPGAEFLVHFPGKNNFKIYIFGVEKIVNSSYEVFNRIDARRFVLLI